MRKIPLDEYLAGLSTMIKSLALSPVGSPGFEFKQCWRKNFDPACISLLHAIHSPDSYEVPNVGVIHDVLPNAPTTTVTTGTLLHIFVDYSNISAGFVGKNNEHPINPIGLSKFLEKGRRCETRQITGSFPNKDDPIWEQWRNLNYRTRITGNGKGKYPDILQFFLLQFLLVC